MLFYFIIISNAFILQSIERLRRYAARISLILNDLRKYANQKKAQNETHHAQHCLDMQLLLKGEWLEVSRVVEFY